MPRFCYIVFMCLLPYFSFAQTAKYSNDFLNIGVGARWLALGGTGVAMGTNLETAYWNPAGLVGMSKAFEVGGMHASYFAGMAAFNHLGFAHRLDSLSAVAFTALRFGVDDIPNTTDLIDSDGNFSYDRLKLFSVADYAFLLSYARKVPVSGLSIGGNAKIIYRNVGQFANAWGFGFDLAAKLRRGPWVFGINIRDITTTINVWSFNSNELEIVVPDSSFNLSPEGNVEITLPQINFGIARSFQVLSSVLINTEVGGVAFFDGKRNTPLSTSIVSIEPKLGVEVCYANLLFVRMGVNNFQIINDFNGKTPLIIQPNLGLGIKFKSVSIDYALTNIGSVGFSRFSNIFSFRWEFDRIPLHGI